MQVTCSMVPADSSAARAHIKKMAPLPSPATLVTSMPALIPHRRQAILHEHPLQSS